MTQHRRLNVSFKFDYTILSLLFLQLLASNTRSIAHFIVLKKKGKLLAESCLP